MLTGLNHLTLAVSDLDRSFDFYRHLLGFTSRPLARRRLSVVGGVVAVPVIG